ncbi:MAG: YkgJ family cysteine cluster protein, partial [Planctomycetota bacterium]
MPSIPGQQWSCHSCSHCCRSLVIHLFEKDREKMDRQGWAERLGIAPYGRAGRGWVLNKRPDGACVFLDENNLCKIHSEFGEEAKPLACRMFPFSVRRVSRGWQASLRFDCPSAAASKGEPLDKARAGLAKLVAGLDHRDPQVEDTAELKRGVSATMEELDTVTASFTRWLLGGAESSSSVPEDGCEEPASGGSHQRGSHQRTSILERLIAAVRITTTLGEATLGKVRGERFTELVDLLFSSAAAQYMDLPLAPTDRQRGMLRQLVFAHAEHISLAELRLGPWGRLRMKWRQLGSARRFLSGTGAVPRLPGVSRNATFDAVEAVESPSEPRTVAPPLVGGAARADEDDILARYLAARLSSRSVFGEGYYGCAVFPGLTSLWLSVAAAGWLARYHAVL